MNKKVYYYDLEQLAHQWKVKVATLERRTRNGDYCYKGTLKFKKYAVDGKRIKRSQRWFMMKITGKYTPMVVFKKV